MRRVLFLLASMLFVWRCAAPAPEPVSAPPVTPPPPPAAAEEKVVGTVRVTASSLNVRKDASTEAEVIAQAKKGERLSVLREEDAWVRVRLSSGEVGWVASRFVESDVRTTKVAPRKRTSKGGCPADSDFAFVETPTPSFSDRGAHGLVIVEANVNTKGVVTSTKVISNSTGDETLAFLAEREIKTAKFSPPIRNCVPKAFIFTYRRTF